MAELCHREGISQNVHYVWVKDFMEAGKARLQGDSQRQANEAEVRELRRENERLKVLLAKQLMETSLFKKVCAAPGCTGVTECTIPALLITPVCAYVSVGMLNPRLLPLMASGDFLWAWLAIAGIAALHIVIIGLVLLISSDYRAVGVVISTISSLEFLLFKYTQKIIMAIGLPGIIFQHFIILFLLVPLATAIYQLRFRNPN